MFTKVNKKNRNNLHRWINYSIFCFTVFPTHDPAFPPPRWLIIASSSSKKIVDGAWNRANSNKTRTSFSESPRHLLTIVDADILKNVVLHSVATALANNVFPVPGGPYKSKAFHGDKIPVNNWGYYNCNKQKNDFFIFILIRTRIG